MAVYGCINLTMLLLAVMYGKKITAGVAVLFASPVPLFYLATRIEGRSVADVVNLAYLPWSLVANAFLLTTVAVLASASISRMPEQQWEKSVSVRRLCVSMIIGLAAGFAFHYVDGQNFVDQGMAAVLNSPTKLAHDFLTIPVLLSGSLYFVRMVFQVRTWHRWAVLACLIGWVVLVVIDTQRGLDLSHLHVEWDAGRFAPL